MTKVLLIVQPVTNPLREGFILTPYKLYPYFILSVFTMHPLLDVFLFPESFHNIDLTNVWDQTSPLRAKYGYESVEYINRGER